MNVFIIAIMVILTMVIVVTVVVIMVIVIMVMVMVIMIIVIYLTHSKEDHRRSQPLLENLDCTGNLKRSADSVDSMVNFHKY